MSLEGKKEDRIKKYVERIHDCINKRGYCSVNIKDNEESEEMVIEFHEIISMYYTKGYGDIMAISNNPPDGYICFVESKEKIPKQFRNGIPTRRI